MEALTPEVQQSCPHQQCGCRQDEVKTFAALSLGENIAKICAALLRLIKLIGPFFKHYFRTKTVSYIVSVDENTTVWNATLIKEVMNTAIRFYKKYGITLTYSLVERDDIRLVKTEERIRPTNGKKTIFFIDDFNNCDNCTLRGYAYGQNVVIRYLEWHKTLWVHLAHELGHAFRLDHGGDSANLMNEIGPNSALPDDVELTICQVMKVKRYL